VRGLAAAAAATLATVTALACGGPDELSGADGDRLARAGDRIEAALATTERMGQSDAAAVRVVGRVRRVVASGSLEAERLDEFGLAALGELRLVAPSLVIVDEREIPRELDRPALRAFLAQAPADPAGALRPGAAAAVREIERVLGAADAAPDTSVPVVEQPVGDLLDELERELEPVWPDLARTLADLEGEL